MKSTRLQQALDAQVATMRELVEATQRERQHLLGVDLPELRRSTQDRAAALERLSERQKATEAALVSLRGDLGLEAAEAPTVTAVAGTLESDERAALGERCSCIKALATALSELNAVNMVHAQRGLRVVRGYAELLTGGGRRANPGSYDRTGKTSGGALTTRILERTI